MQNLNNKLGVTNIVVSVLLVVIAIAAVGITAVFVTKLVGEPKFSPLVSCIEMQSSNAVKIVRACKNTNSNEVEITLQRGFAESEISHLNFAISSDDGGSAWVCGDLCGECFVLSPETRKTYYFAPEGSGVPQRAIVGVDSCELDEMNIVNC